MYPMPAFSAAEEGSGRQTTIPRAWFHTLPDFRENCGLMPKELQIYLFSGSLTPSTTLRLPRGGNKGSV
jgi:hypothetical protein